MVVRTSKTAAATLSHHGPPDWHGHKNAQDGEEAEGKELGHIGLFFRDLSGFRVWPHPKKKAAAHKQGSSLFQRLTDVSFKADGL